MKIRVGFVSNSSTSSFCMYCANFSDGDDMTGRYNKIHPTAPMGRDFWKPLRDLDLEYHWVEGGGYYIGVSMLNMKMEETRQQFEDRVAKVLKDNFGEDIEVGPAEEAYAN